MLQTDDRVLLREAIRPPEGYELDSAIITTFSLDLLSLLTVPLYFTLFEVEGEDGANLGDPLALLQALRRHAGHITVFCQAGEIAVPMRQQQLFGYLEDSIVEVHSPRPNGVFHPKVWALRYAAPDQPIVYRLACFSRNLTADRSWDTAIVLEGELQDRKVGYTINRPLGDFISALPSLSVRELEAKVSTRSATMAEELRRVKFELPEGFDEVNFWPTGHKQKFEWPFEGRADKMLVVSPFVSSGALARLSKLCPDIQLVSRTDALDAIEDATLDGLAGVNVLADAVEAERAEEVTTAATDAPSALSGLHAKLYVIDHGWNASLLSGSTNATNAARECNVEFLIELVGKKSTCGVSAILAGEKGQNGLGALLQPYTRAEGLSIDLAQQELEDAVDTCARTIAAMPWRLLAIAQSDGNYSLEVRRTGAPPSGLESGLEMTCWPITQQDTFAVKFDPAADVSATITSASPEALTTFLAVSVTGRRGERSFTKRFVLNLPLEGGPPDRRERILRTVLRDRARVLRFLLLLLGDVDAILSGEVTLPGDATDSAAGHGGGSDATLLEPLVRALHRDPGRLDQIARVVQELKASEDADLLPEHFASIWDAVWSVRQEAGT